MLELNIYINRKELHQYSDTPTLHLVNNQFLYANFKNNAGCQMHLTTCIIFKVDRIIILGHMGIGYWLNACITQVGFSVPFAWRSRLQSVVISVCRHSKWAGVFPWTQYIAALRPKPSTCFTTSGSGKTYHRGQSHSPIKANYLPQLYNWNILLPWTNKQILICLTII